MAKIWKNSMFVQSIKPKNKILQYYIDEFWILQAEPAPPPIRPILPPKTNFDLILSFAAPTIWKDPREQKQLLKSSFLCGIRKGKSSANHVSFVKDKL